MWYTILFVISLAGILLMLLIKILEEKKYFRLIPISFSNKFENGFIENTNLLKNYLSELDIKKVYILAKNARDKILKIFLILLEKISKKFNNSDAEIVKFVKGEKILSRNGEASKFLQDVTEHKRNLRNEE